MRTIPSAPEILRVVAHYLRDDLASRRTAPDKFHALVAANAIDIVSREIQHGAAADSAALARLRHILGDPEGSLDHLDARLAEAIASGDIALDSPVLRDHLIRTALDELAIDQPRYATIERFRDHGDDDA